DQWPSWSYDGRWIYFASDRSGDLQLWKEHPEGGDAVRVTANGGGRAFESRDGKYIYYQKPGPGIWRMPVEDGVEELVLAKVRTESYYGWAITDEGIYFIDRAQGNAVIEFYSFATRRVTPIATSPQLTGLAISNDYRWLLYSQLDEENGNIMLV